MISVGQFSVEIGEDVRVADVLLAPTASVPRKAISTGNAILLAEVLSLSSKGPDFGSKRHLYQALGSLEIYVVASQDEPRLWIWQRTRDAARHFPEQPLEVQDRTAMIHLERMNVFFTLHDVYRHVFPID